MAKNISVIIIFLSCAVPVLCFAATSAVDQALDDMETSLRYKGVDKFQDIKAEIGTLLEENKTLQARHDKLKRMWDQLQRTIKETKESVAFKKSPKQNLTDSLNQSPKELRETVTRLENEILVKQSKNTILKARLLDMEDHLGLYQLKFLDLKNQLSQLQMDSQLKEFKAKAVHSKEENEINNLKKEIEFSALAEKQWSGRLLQSQKIITNMPLDTQKLKLQNAEFQKNLESIKKERNIKERELSLMNNKVLLAQRMFEVNVGDKIQERKVLENTIKKLESQYDSLNTAINTSLSKQDEQRKLLDDVMMIDQENQVLRQKISDLEVKAGPFDQ